MTKPRLGKVEALFYVLQQIKTRGCAILTHPHVIQTAVVDSIIISEDVIKMTECPQEMTEILTMIKLYGESVKELMTYRNNLLELQRKVQIAIQ